MLQEEMMIRFAEPVCELFQQCRRTTDAGMKVFAHQLAAQARGGECRQQNIRVEHQSHEMSLNASSSV